LQGFVSFIFYAGEFKVAAVGACGGFACERPFAAVANALSPGPWAIDGKKTIVQYEKLVHIGQHIVAVGNDNNSDSFLL